MVSMWEDAKNEYAVLSTYVQDIEHLGEEGDGKHKQVPHLCMITFTSNVRTHATKCANDLSKPKLTNAVWGAGLSFSKCHAELKVQVDPHTPHIFDGEEFNRAARFWTYGYDIYTPNHVYVLHDYHGSQSNPKTIGWNANPTLYGTFADSNKRLRTMIDMPDGEKDPEVVNRMKKSKFGLGDRRTIDQLIQFSGIDLRNLKVTIDGKNRCGNIQWVPFQEHPKGVNYIPAFDPETEDPLDLPYDPSSVWFNPEIDGQGSVQNQYKKDGNIENVEDIIGNTNIDKMHAALSDTLESVEKEEKEEMSHESILESHDLAKMHQALASKIGKLRGRAKAKVDAVKGYLHEHPLITPTQVHGFEQLPLFVKCNVFILISGLIFFICKGKGTGRGFRRKSAKNA